MLADLKGILYSFISAWIYPLLIVPAFWLEHEALIGYLGILGTLSLVWAILLFRRYRLIEDTEPTRLSSAAQGYVELRGKAALYDNEVGRSLHYELPPMVWYRYLFRSSWSGFFLRDEKGQCTIDPRDAEVITPVFKYNQFIYNAIYPGETIYALGNLETLKKHNTEWEHKGLIISKLVEWKRAKHTFLDYFDANKDGRIDDGELQVAKQAAEREVDQELDLSYQQPATHVVSRAHDGRPFILSSIHPDSLVKRYKVATMLHLAAWGFLLLIALLLQ